LWNAHTVLVSLDKKMHIAKVQDELDGEHCTTRDTRERERERRREVEMARVRAELKLAENALNMAT
jgi:hypothetical protein